jgi:hypothetical protein
VLASEPIRRLAASRRCHAGSADMALAGIQHVCSGCGRPSAAHRMSLPAHDGAQVPPVRADKFDSPFHARSYQLVIRAAPSWTGHLRSKRLRSSLGVVFPLLEISLRKILRELHLGREPSVGKLRLDLTGCGKSRAGGQLMSRQQRPARRLGHRADAASYVGRDPRPALATVQKGGCPARRLRASSANVSRLLSN